MPLYVKSSIFAQCPDIEADFIKFIKFMRSKRLPSTSCRIEANEFRDEHNYNHSEFGASTEWL